MTAAPHALGAPWASKSQFGWSLRRLKDIAKVVNGYPFDSKLFDAAGEHELVRIRDLNSTTTETRYNGEWVEAAAVQTGDVLVGMDGDFNVGVWKGARALLNQRVCCVRGETPLLTRFLSYVLPTPLKVTNDLTYFTTVKHLSSLDVERFTLYIPSPEFLEQTVNFLDEQTSRIDALIAEKGRLLALLEESRSGAIESAVLAPPGLAVCALKRVCTSIATGPFGSALHSSDYVEGGVPVINPSHLVEGKVQPESSVSVPEEMAVALSSYRVRSGQVLVGRRGEMGRCAVVSEEVNGWLCGTGCLAVSVRDGRALPDYVQLVISSRAAREWLSLESVGSTMENLNAEILGRLPGYFPGIEEQMQRVNTASSAKATHDELSEHVLTHIDRLREYRSSLISAAVTGQLDLGVPVPTEEELETAE